MTTPKKHPQKPAGNGSGADFQAFLFSAHPEWSLWAVESPLDLVATEFANQYDGSVWARDVLVMPPKKKGAELVSMVPIVQLKNSSWVIGFRSIGWFMERHYTVPEEAEYLSRKLKTRSLSFIRQDTAGSIHLRQYVNGKKTQQILTEDYPSSLEKTFQELGLYLPACILDEDSKSVFLIVQPQSEGRIEKADIVLLNP